MQNCIVIWLVFIQITRCNQWNWKIFSKTISSLFVCLFLLAIICWYRNQDLETLVISPLRHKYLRYGKLIEDVIFSLVCSIVLSCFFLFSIQYYKVFCAFAKLVHDICFFVFLVKSNFCNHLNHKSRLDLIQPI